MLQAPVFSEFWDLTNKTGFKEKLAKRWHYLPHNHKIIIFEKVKNLKEKPSAEQYLNLGK
jgi:uncharacterized protein (DUF1919 family)